MSFVGKDIGPHPEIPGRQSAAPHPTRDEIMCNKNNSDLPVNFVEPIKKKAKRHLIHQQLDPVAEEQPIPQLAPPAFKEEVFYTSESDGVGSEELDQYEVMKEIYYKAGVEMESDDREELEKEADVGKVEGLEEWKDDSIKMVVPKGSKKPAKRSKSTKSNASNSIHEPPIVKQRRTKSESAARSMSPLDTQIPASEATPSAAKPTPTKMPNTFPGYRIPKKVSPAVTNDCDGWTDDDQNASRTLAGMAGYYKQQQTVNKFPSLCNRQTDQQHQQTDVFCKTRIQKPSASSHIKSICPVTVVKRFHSPPRSSSQLCSSWGGSANHQDRVPADVTSNTGSVQQMSPMKSTGSVDERRSRKQKSPRSNRSGIDSRDIATDL